MTSAIEILNRIVAENGNCSGWAKKATCAACPLSRLKVRSDGTHLSCIEAIDAHNLSEELADARYVDVAKQILLDMAIETMLKEDDGPK